MMKKRLTFLLAVTVAALAAAPAPLAAQSAAPGAGAPALSGSSVQVPTAQEEQLSAADELKGAQVRDPQGQVIGAIEELVVDLADGTVAYMIVAPAQYAGEQVIIPWKAAQPEPATAGAPAEGKRAVVLDIPRSKMLQAPETGVDTLDREQERAIHEFYGVSPYWEGDQQEPGTLRQAPPLPPGHPPVLPPGHPPIGTEGAR
jgi:sporulation protein YlmC with PRC-barrel domain